MKVKETNYKKSSGVDSVRFWLQGNRFVKFMLDIIFYIILLLVIEFATSQNKSIPADFRYKELLFALKLNLFILGYILYVLFLSVKTEKEKTLVKFCEPFICINIFSFIFQLIGVKKDEESFSHLCFHWSHPISGFLSQVIYFSFSWG